MIKKLPILLSLFSFIGYCQGITVSTTAYTPAELVNTVLLNSQCGSASNITKSTFPFLGVGYFNRADSNFPFAEGIVLRSGNVGDCAGQYTGSSSSGDTPGDSDLNTIIGGNTTTYDAAYLKFDIIPYSNILSFNFIYASNEYGQYQCSYSDVFAFILTDLSTGNKINMGVIPGTTTPVSGLTVNNSLYGGTCVSANPAYFDRYNVSDVANSSINMAGQTVPMTAMAAVIPNHSYSIKIVVANKSDGNNDSAVFIEGGSLGLNNQCGKNLKLVAFVDTNADGEKNEGENTFSHGSFNYHTNNQGTATELYSSNGVTSIFPEIITDTYDVNLAIDAEYTGYYSVAAGLNDISYIENGDNVYYIPVINTQSFSDVSIALIPITEPNPGFYYKEKIAYTNKGTLPVSGTITFTKDIHTDELTTPQTATTITATGFTYEYTDLLPLETRYINLRMKTIPTVTLMGDLLTNTVNLTNNATDILPANNTNSLTQIVIASFDPNDKSESHGGKVEIADFNTDDYLYYTIRFQNIGTTNAVNIKIEDILDSQLDEESIRMLNASHDYMLERKGNELVWSFNGIYLPGQAQNDIASQGYVYFKIKPKPGFTAGDMIPNHASIYFDFNTPIVTNTTETQFLALGTPIFNLNSISAYPNPSNSIVTINSNSTSVVLDTIKVTDILGKTILTSTPKSNQSVIDVSMLTSGIYLLEIMTSSQQKAIKKIIIN